MTLSPVFRSPRAVQLLRDQGVWAGMAPAIDAQARAVRTVHDDLSALLAERFRTEPPALPEAGDTESETALGFLQEYFFLILFRSLFEALGASARNLAFYAELNFCIKGTITAADNLFDDQGKSLLPLREDTGPRFLSILQLMAFERLIRRVGDRGVEQGILSPEERDEILRGLLDLMAEIGRLEGSEEGGVADIPDPDVMVERVHRIRGGALFALSFIAPRVLETGALGASLERAEPAIARLGTAFQIVDDLTDFEFDMARRSHNLLAAQVRHHGSPGEREVFDAIWAGERQAEPGMVEGVFGASARAVLERAYAEARRSFAELSELGFWMPVELADEVVHAIVGMDGVSRMEALARSGGDG